MRLPIISPEAVTKLTSAMAGAFTKVANVTEQLAGGILNHFVTRHVNVTYDLAKNVTNITAEGVSSLVKSIGDVGMCEFTFTNVTISGNTTEEVVSYNPVNCGLYGLYPPIKYLLILVLIGFLLWTLFGNGCLIGVVMTDKDMQEPGNIFLCALALCDIAQCLMFSPSAIHSLLHGVSPGWLGCRIQAFLVSFLSCLTIYLQAGLLFCRWVHIAFPYHFAKHLASSRLALGMAACFFVALVPPLVGIARVGRVSTWALDVAAADIAVPVSLLLPCTPGGTESTVTTFLCGLGQIIVCCIAGLISKVAWDNEKKHDTKRAWAAQADQLPKKLKAAKTFGIVVGVQWASWVPLIILVIAHSAPIWGDITYIIMQTSTFSDSLVYAYRNDVYRKAMKRAFRKMRRMMNDLW
ncbi:olfactory receptor 2L3-like [Branchiostoma floridae]|uniref:Olfactory receptor 2L3-like n=1 Tax=Branchiostoma floridae TaxID=7739 RepID=A0A9J7L6G9_BRAFL|nr:olfactory receptor 2L3-like [Branchiostoma floridae]